MMSQRRPFLFSNLCVAFGQIPRELGWTEKIPGRQIPHSNIRHSAQPPTPTFASKPNRILSLRHHVHHDEVGRIWCRLSPQPITSPSWSSSTTWTSSSHIPATRTAVCQPPGSSARLPASNQAPWSGLPFPFFPCLLRFPSRTLLKCQAKHEQRMEACVEAAGPHAKPAGLHHHRHPTSPTRLPPRALPLLS
ncbi:hypothetical protein EJ06DRAFT_296306 [Trichodelitschia bisporula]|uniref:Uncharacterized protein n=1 Tax=Trichodelitschia bisporula TaxID=703511 RepID=A0A6G1I6Z6_9PEZI|nr:hypothetical protein EJ06DRAFT_296306 [Trichodelitschia bisporula]